jgi:hypothetical protein
VPYEKDADCALPAEAMHHTNGMLIEAMECAIGGQVSKLCTMAWSLAANVFSQQPAPVLGSGQPREVGERYTIWNMAWTWSYPHTRLW